MGFTKQFIYRLSSILLVVYRISLAHPQWFIGNWQIPMASDSRDQKDPWSSDPKSIPLFVSGSLSIPPSPIQKKYITAWCFGTCLPIFFGNVIIPTDELHHFSEGWLNRHDFPVALPMKISSPWRPDFRTGRQYLFQGMHWQDHLGAQDEWGGMD